MKVCLNCQKKFEAKRERAKFCSDLCRATFNQLSKAGLKIKIYSLVNPIDNKVFYIGRTIGKLETRLKAHIADIKNKSNLKAKIISEILSNDLMPIISTIEEHPCSSEAEEIEINKREDYWISKYKNEGVDLCNVAGVDYEYKSILFFKPKNTTTQRVLIEIDDEVLAKLDKQAQAEKRSRKNYMEVILENAANGNNPIIERQYEFANGAKESKPAPQSFVDLAKGNSDIPQEPLDKVSQFCELIQYADNRKEIEKYVAQAKKELDWKLFLRVQSFAFDIVEKKGFIYND